VASIRPSENGRPSIETKPGSITIRNWRLVESIAWAFEIQDFQVSGTAWLNELRFHILAKAESPAKEADMRVMLRRLLVERFKLELTRVASADQRDPGDGSDSGEGRAQAQAGGGGGLIVSAKVTSTGRR
jgi:uncharacterized protein (TIGR03435 family)